MVYVGIAIAIPVFAVLVSGFSPFQSKEPTVDPEVVAQNKADQIARLEKYGVKAEYVEEVRETKAPPIVERGKPYQMVQDDTIKEIEESGKFGAIAAVFVKEVSKPAGLVLALLGLLSFGYLIRETFRLDRIPRERMIAALVLIFFQMLFFAFFEQAGSSLNNFADRNVDRVASERIVTEDMVGQSVRLQPTQEQLGYDRAGEAFTISALDELREDLKEHTDFDIEWTLTESNVGMTIAERNSELPATVLQAINPTYILLLALLFNILWAFLRKAGLDFNAAVKFAMGLVQLGLGFGAIWLGAQMSNERGMVSLIWLLLGYLLQTTGELCLSPVGLSAMTKLSPARLVSTLMGAWFLATAFSQYLAAIISQFTGVKSEGGNGDLPIPSETVHVYGDVFGTVALTAIASGVVCLAVSPILGKWMHPEDTDGESEPESEA